LIIEESKDKDAKWLKKGKQCVFGYKGHTLVDKDNGLIQAIEVTPANVYDEKMLMLWLILFPYLKRQKYWQIKVIVDKPMKKS